MGKIEIYLRYFIRVQKIYECCIWGCGLLYISRY